MFAFVAQRRDAGRDVVRELPADARRVDGRSQLADDVALTTPGRAGGVGDGLEARQGVVRERPDRAARQRELRQVPLVVERPRDTPTQRVGG